MINSTPNNRLFRSLSLSKGKPGGCFSPGAVGITASKTRQGRMG